MESPAVLLDRLMPRPDVRERHEVLVKAPAPLVFEVASAFSLQSVPLVRAIFWLRALAMRSKTPPTWPREGLVAETPRMGWGRLAEEPGRFYIAGASCQPWLADVVFSPIAPDRFEAYAHPDRVKIVWTLEAEPAGDGLTRLATETRAAATDDQARSKFRRYWRVVRIGIVAIRWLLLPAVRREAERRFRQTVSRAA